MKDQMHKMQKKHTLSSSYNKPIKGHKLTKSASSCRPHKIKNVYLQSMKQKNEKKEELRKWLKDMGGLQVYFGLFVENGLNNLNIMKHVKMTDLVLLGISNLADRVKIMQSIQRLKYKESIEQSATEIIYKSASI